MNTGVISRDAGPRPTIDQINADYRATVARRQAEYARREAASHAFWLFVSQVCAVLNYMFCGVLIVLSIEYAVEAVQTQYTPTPVGVFVTGFIFAQACCWTYIVLFPRYFASLN